MIGADGVAADQHALDDAVGVALEDGAVHERAGVALVGITDDVLLVAGLVVGGLPLHAGGEARAAAAAQAGLLHLLDDGHAVAALEDLGEGQIAVL